MKKPAKKSASAKTLAAFPGHLVLLGAGKMGGAMLDGWLARGLEAEAGRRARAACRQGDQGAGQARPVAQSEAGEVKADAAAIVIAVKPQIAPEAVPPLGLYVGKSTLVVSIMAGRTIGFSKRNLPRGAAIVRAMPNTPAAIGRGITVAVPNARVSARAAQAGDRPARATGAVEWVDDETLMDAVTAVSGSGPGLCVPAGRGHGAAGVAAGLPAELAGRLARETVAGSGELLHRSDLDAATLRQNVTSPGGTTAAALEVLMGPAGFDALMTKAIAAATKRSQELAG